MANKTKTKQNLCDECRFVSTAIAWNLRFSCFYCSFTALMMLYSKMHLS